MTSAYKKFTLDFHARAWIRVEVVALSLEEALKKGRVLKLCDKVMCGKGAELAAYNYKFVGAQQAEMFHTDIEEE